jgi:hypothetical protein
MTFQRSTAPPFLTGLESMFVSQHGFVLEEHYDDAVMRFYGTYLSPEASAILVQYFGEELAPMVWINFNDNRDIGCPRTYKVEVGVGRACGEARGISTFGLFGRSSSACTSLEVAFTEAAIRFVMQLFVPPSNIVAFGRRLDN